jgi:hypothetical protein
MRKLATNVFDISVLIVGVCLNVHSITESISFSIYAVKVCFVLYNLLYQFSQLPVSVEHLNLRKPEMAELVYGPTTGLQGGPFTEPCISVKNCQYCTKFSICYLNDNVATTVFRSSSTIMCN